MNTIKKFIHYYGPYKTVFFIDLICAAVISLIDLAYPQILRTMTKTLFTQDQSRILHALPVIAGGLFLMYVIQCLCKYYVTCQGHMMGANMERDMRQELFDHYQQLSFSYYSQNNSGQMMSKLVSDLFDISEFAHHGPENLFISLVKIIGAFVFLFFINKKLAFPLIILVIVMFWFSFKQNARMQTTFMENRRKIGDVNASLQDTLSGIRVVKNFVREDHEIEKFDTISGTIYKDFSLAERILALNSPLMQGCVYACMILVSWLGAKQIVIGNMSTGNLMSFFTYIMQILSSLMMLSMVFVMITLSIASAERVTEVLNEKADICNPENPVMEVKDGSVVFDHVDFRYKKDAPDYALKGIDLSIRSGETIGIIGGTGSSKSSLVNLISRLYDVENGSVLVGGKDVREYDLEVLRNEVAVVLQKNVLFSGTILDNLRWGDKEATKEECIRACKLACADEFIQKLPNGYETYIEQGGTNVSGGQKQRICIARALLKKPKILILDDSTSAVDTATDAKIRKAFAEEIPGTTKIIIAQRISSVSGCDRIIVMEDGQVDGFDTHKNLIENNQIYREVYESQTGGGSGDFDEEGKE